MPWIDVFILIAAICVILKTLQGMPVHTQHYMMLQRDLLYAAVTRGKKLVVLVGTKKALGWQCGGRIRHGGIRR
jgi:exodeoxyribonuclease V alpha subunit